MTPETTLLRTDDGQKPPKNRAAAKKNKKVADDGAAGDFGEASDNSSATSCAGRDFGSEIGSGLILNEMLAYISFYRNKSTT